MGRAERSVLATATSAGGATRLFALQPAASIKWPAAFSGDWTQRLLAWPTRGSRVVLLMVVICLLNYVDLGLTLIEARNHLFIELNPLASRLIQHPPPVLIAYKVVLVLVGGAILIALRNHRITEWACWLLFSAYGFVALRWAVYYSHLLETFNDPASHVVIVRGMLSP